jgi:hypothetical protein
MRALIFLAVAACTYEEKVLEGPFSCAGAAPPRTAPDLVKIGGTVRDPENRTPVIAAGVQLQTAPTGSAIASTVTDFNGHFSFDLNTNGAPVSGIDIHVSATNFVDSYYFASHPIAGDIELEIVSILTTSEAATLFSDAGLSMTGGAGHILLSVSDCLEQPLAGATLASTPAGTLRYFNGIIPAPTATATDVGGVVLDANLAPGKVTLTAMTAGHPFSPHEVTVVANAFTVTDVQP